MNLPRMLLISPAKTTASSKEFSTLAMPHAKSERMRIWNYLACRLWRPRDYWHNRHFDSRYSANEKSPGAWDAKWRSHNVPTRSLHELVQTPHPVVCHIIASGPSLASLREPSRLFN